MTYSGQLNQLRMVVLLHRFPSEAEYGEIKYTFEIEFLNI